MGENYAMPTLKTNLLPLSPSDPASLRDRRRDDMLEGQREELEKVALRHKQERERFERKPDQEFREANEASLCKSCTYAFITECKKAWGPATCTEITCTHDAIKGRVVRDVLACTGYIEDPFHLTKAQDPDPFVPFEPDPDEDADLDALEQELADLEKEGKSLDPFEPSEGEDEGEEAGEDLEKAGPSVPGVEPDPEDVEEEEPDDDEKAAEEESKAEEAEEDED